MEDELGGSRSAIPSLNDDRPAAAFSSSELSSDRATLLSEAILDSLAPALINDRESQIVKSYSDTFAWIFDPERHAFAPWLSGITSPRTGKRKDEGVQQDNIFWITGKSGSGKSTLMQHIHQNPELLNLLQQWSIGKAVTVATFFFWESGTVMQRSRGGLLRALVFQLLNQHPQLLPSAMPALWSRLFEASTLERVRTLATWDEEELESALMRYVEIPNRPPTYLHIDGLDELEGNQKELIHLIERIATCENVKICVSSREWDVFADAFQDVPSLRVQDLTKEDMRRFVRGRLSSQPGIAKLLDDQPGQDEQLRAILVEKSAGVFLWVSLAVAEISGSLDKIKVPSIGDLQKQVEDLPQGLDNFYRYKLIDHSILPYEMSKILQLLKSRQEVAAFTRDNDTSITTVWEMILAGYDKFSVDEVAELQIQQVPVHDVERRCRDMTESIRKATASLVRVQHTPDLPMTAYGVTYIHRTIKDWLSNPGIWKEILSFAPNINPHLAHLQSVILSLKLTTTKPRRSRTIMTWWSRIVLAMTHARYIPPSSTTCKATSKLLDTLNDTLSWYYHPVRDPDTRIDHWARTCFGTLEERGKTPFENPFLALTVKFGVVIYVKYYLSLGLYQEPKDGAGKSILQWSTMYLLNRQQSLYPLANPQIVEALLQHGLNPNHRVKRIEDALMGQKKSKKPEKSPWEATLEAVQQGLRRGWINVEPRDSEEIEYLNLKRWTNILKTFLQYGADARVEVCATYKDKNETALILVERVRDAIPCGETEELFTAFLGKVSE